MQKVRAKLSFANVMSVIAVFIALGGVGYAATRLPKNSVGSTQIVNGSVKGLDVKNKSLTTADFKGSLRGPMGPTGAGGPTGPTGTLWAVVHHVSSSGVLVRSQGAIGIQRTAAGNYDVQFNRAVNNCSASATQIDYGAVETVQAYTNQDNAVSGLEDSEVHVQLVDNGATPQDISFNVQVFC